MGAFWGAVAVADQETDRAMGSLDLSRDRGDLEVSWVFLPEYWAAGFAREAVIASVFEQGADQRIIAVTQTANTASRNLALRLGMRREAIVEEWPRADPPRPHMRSIRPAHVADRLR
jgi:RimJ/RimL family protein N-acetyltransferase